ncbi:hypothetical protein EV361DRAFT_590343 [Lentinula raphanica]|nr:hypothetical protein EV361DRAFT_590343 [Lentinula raphanica]
MVHSSHHLLFVLVTFLAAVGNITQVVAVPVGAPGESGTQQVASSSDSSSPPDASTVYQRYAKHPCASFGVILCLEARKNFLLGCKTITIDGSRNVSQRGRCC